ncbi:type II toxin-antitoxin system RelE/ParE family toxin (plasmid) [Rhizobium sp. CB3171]|uniref:type II toxin-antitoxin system RelE/ParE family toxin n=1 Tax=Rhizobium sp. CB3171 TaxID=3039157 RepID=UPI0024B04F1B|nr:type II toxin-antitoxin system RelE/ParE family toxin [Rhizobium sp. CB3171]WFU06580.1 type II toxin-antitoxin system RelE/ParE family toxin [Rhizobium sp. CB3171]
MIARVFKTSWFGKAARKAHISDTELLKAIKQVAEGKVDDLGGGVFKKRLNDNMHRSIILANAGRFWVYEYLFAKQDRANIENDELLKFRKLAKSYASLSEEQLQRLVEIGHFVEIGNDKNT